MQKLSNLVDELASYIPQLEARNEAVSASSVGWQIEHSLLVISSVIEGVKRSDPSKYKWSFRPIKYLIFWRGKIPRGKIGAPKIVIPGEITQDTLQAHIALCRQRLDELEQLGAGHYFTHPFFGDLRMADTLSFLFIHTEHHLKIIRVMLAH
ncbi:DinB family protein [Aquirufa sp. 2-AUSEE-184A6]|jgi:hypothetical protein|uniref:DinB family protein n=1 Tax=Aquirufa novilacunae TaxID=3139305 RepID=A0ABW8SXH3_9BACT